MYREKYPESLDPAMPGNLAYTGPFKVTDPSGVPGVDAGKLILSPTRTYAPVMKEILDKHRKNIHGLVHCSGGGQTKVLHFVDKIKIIKDNLFPVPPLFALIQEHSGTSWQEMFKVFNMGHRMEIYLPEEFAEDIISISGKYKIEARIIGHCDTGMEKSLVIRHLGQEFFY
jgi:phosphoribosylformylglycinamidine cyclo-ligase